MSLILNIDSSLQNAFVCISRNGSVLKHLTNPVQKDHAAFLHVAIKQLSEELALKPQELDAIAVTSGPGSYTGLRVGFAAAKGLSFALNKPFISISTLKVMAKAAVLNTGINELYYCPLIDARRMEVYTALYNSDIEELTAPHALVLNEQSFDFEMQSKKIFFFGSGTDKWKAIVKNPNALYTETGELYEAMSLLSFERYTAQKFSDIVTAAPLYAKEFYNG